MHLGEVIKAYREEHNLSMQAFADKCEVSKGYIAMLEKNVNSKTGEPVTPSIETFIKVARALNITTSELFDKVDENRPKNIEKPVVLPGLEKFRRKWNENVADFVLGSGRKVPVYGRVAAGIPIEAVENIIDWEEIPADWTGDYGCLVVKGDSMSPRILEGDRLIVKRQDDAESGDIVVAMVNGHDACCKRLIKYADGIALQSFNPAYEPMYFSKVSQEKTPVTIWGKVVELRGKF